MDSAVKENHKLYKQRLEQYKKYGYDVENERKAIVAMAQPITGRVLEVGTGKGYFTLVLARKGVSFTSIDISPEDQAIARLNLRYYGCEDKVTLLCRDAGILPFDDASFDMVFSVNVLHHLETPFTVIDEMLRVVCPGGKLVISDFTLRGMRLIGQIHQDEGKTHDYGVVTMCEVEQFITRRDFSFVATPRELQKTIIILKPQI